MKKIFLSILLTASVAFGQLPGLLQDEFSQSDNTNLVGTSSWIASPYSSDGPLVTSSGTAIASNTQGVNFYGGMIWNSLLTNNGTDTAVVAFSIPTKSITNRYFNGLPGVSDVEIYLFMDNTSSTWNGTVMRMISWDNDQYSMVFNTVTNGCVDYASCTNYGGTGAADWGGSAGNANDTIAVKVIGQTIFVERHTTAGVVFRRSVTAARTIPSSGYIAARLRLSTTPTTQLGAFFLGAPTATPPTPVDRDTIPPVKVSAAPNVAAIDTSVTHYYIFRAQDNNTATQKNPGLKYMTIRVDSLGGVFKDSVSSLSNYPNIAGGDTTIITVAKKRPAGTYLITNTAVDDSNNVLVYQYTIAIGTAQTLKVMAYYDIWQMIGTGTAWWAEPPDRLNYHNGITHIIQFMNANVKNLVNPFFGPVNGVSLSDSLDAAGGSGRPSVLVPYRDWWIDSCHNNNIRALLCVNAVNPAPLQRVIDQNWNGVVDGIDSARADTLARAIAQYLGRHRYDGVDINIEHDSGYTASKANVALFLRRLRAQLDSVNAGLGGKMLMTLSPTSGDYNNYDIPNLNNVADFVNVQTYDQQYSYNPCVSSNANWFWSAINHASDAQLAAHVPPYNTCWDLPNRTSAISKRGPIQWAAAGMSMGKMGIGISSYGRLHSGSLDPYGPMGTDNYVITNSTFLNNFLAASPTAVTRFDTVTKGTYTAGVLAAPLSYTGAVSGTFGIGTNVYYTYPTQSTVSAIVDWAKANGVGSVMVFDYQYDNNATDPDVTKRNPVIEMVASTAGGGIIVTPPPSTPTNTSPTNGATNQSTNGTLFTWSAISGATSYNLQISTFANFSLIDRQGSVNTNSASIGTFPFSSSLTGGQTYYWRVNATTAGGTSSYSTATSFATASTIANAPSTPLLVTPVADSAIAFTSVTLTISPGGNDTIQTTIFQVKSDTLSAQFVYNDSSGNSFAASVANLIPGLNYWWRAAAKNTAGRSANTAWRKFRITAPTVIARQYESVYRFNPTLRRNVSSPEAYTIKSDLAPASLPTAATDSPYVVWGVRAWREANGVLHQYAYTTDIPAFNFNANAPLSWNSSLSTISLPQSSPTQDGYLSSSNFSLFSGAVTKPMFNWMLPGGLRDSSRLVLKAGTNVTITKSGDTATVAASGGSFSSIRASGYSSLTDSAIIAAGSNVTVTQSGRTISIASSGGSGSADTSIFNNINIVDEFVASRTSDEGISQSNKSSTGKEIGDLGWTMMGMASSISGAITFGQQWVNTSTYGNDLGWTYFYSQDSSADGTTPVGGLCTLGPNGPIKYGTPTNAINYARFRTPQRDSTIATVGWTAYVSPPTPLNTNLTEGAWIEAGRRDAGSNDSIYAVTCTGAAKTKTLITTVAKGTVVSVKIVFKSGSIDFYAGATSASLTGPVNIATNLPTGTNGLEPVFGTWTYQKRRNASPPSAGITIGSWQYKEWVSR